MRFFFDIVCIALSCSKSGMVLVLNYNLLQTYCICFLIYLFQFITSFFT